MEENTLRKKAIEKEPSEKDEKLCEPQQRVLRILRCLTGHEDSGLSLTQISQATGISKITAYRDLFNLIVAGFVEKKGESYRTDKAVRDMFSFYSETLKQRIDSITKELRDIVKK